MRTYLTALAGLTLSSTALAGEPECGVPMPCAPQCAMPTRPTVSAPTPTNERFLRGPAPGTAAGESNSLGIRGPVLHFPEIRIALPTLELPSLFHARHDATKFFNATQSPLVDEPALELDNVGVEAPAPTAPAPTATTPCVPYCPPACAVPNRCASLDEQLKQLDEKLARLERLEAQLATLRTEQLTSLRTDAPAITHNAPAKPVVVKRQTAAPVASRPISKSAPSKLQNVAYEEIVDEPAPTTNARSTPRVPVADSVRPTFGLSKPSPARGKASEFGDWTQQ